ncbi:MAG: hypothetical protein IMF01_07880 [Proteobacteria bacterium]|nr:hypothetical protein [Pseudomonadota bacterium]
MVESPEAGFENSMLMYALDLDDILDSSAIHTHVSSLPIALDTFLDYRDRNLVSIS